MQHEAPKPKVMDLKSAGTGKAMAFCAPSGAGKTTLVKSLMSSRNDVAFSISATNRALRGDEIDGKDYHFLTTEGFRERVEAGEFLEWEEVYPGRFYGTLLEAVEAIWSSGKHVAFDVDVEGGIRLKELLGDRILTVFVQPPSLEVLAKRLENRGTDSPSEIERRLAKADLEMKRANLFDHILINDDLMTACGELTKTAELFLSPNQDSRPKS